MNDSVIFGMESLNGRGLSSKRNAMLSTLEEEHPRSHGRISAQEILDLHVVNALLAEAGIYTSSDRELERADLALIQGMQDSLCQKVLSLTVLQLLTHESAGGSSALKEVVQGHEGEFTMFQRRCKLEAKVGGMYAFVRELLQNNACIPKEMSVLLKGVKPTLTVLVLRDVCDAALEALTATDGKRIAAIERLLSSFHMSGPWLEYLCDRPWEVENVLTCVFADTLHACPTRPSVGIISIAKHLPRESFVKQVYFNPSEVTLADVQAMADIARQRDSLPESRLSRPIFQLALALNRRVPMELLLEIQSLPYNLGELPQVQGSYAPRKYSLQEIVGGFGSRVLGT